LFAGFFVGVKNARLASAWRFLQNCQNGSGFWGICLQEWSRLCRPFQYHYLRFCIILCSFHPIQPKYDKEQGKGGRIMSNIIEQWIESRGNEALQKLLHDETLTFEDKVILAMVANREEVKSVREEMRKEFASVRSELQSHREETRKEFASVRSELQSHREETRKEFASVREETRKEFASVNARFDKVDARFDKTDARIEKLENRIHDMQNAQNALVWKILGGTGTILALSKAIEHFLK
jgi:Mg2+ and Co2+ transporter CorA